MRMRKKGSLLIAMGLLLLAAALLLTCYNVWDARRADRASQTALSLLRSRIPGMEPPAQPDSAPTEAPTEVSTEAPAREPAAPSGVPEETELPEQTMPTVEIDGYRYIGVLDVPTLGLSLPVMEQWDYSRLKIAPCRFSGSVYRDDLVICAHNYSTHFGSLRYAPIGTAVMFTDADGQQYGYTVVSQDTLGPNDVELMVSGDWDLTLFTCNTGGQNRCAIRCDRQI